jgi:ATP-dependent Lon protease
VTGSPRTFRESGPGVVIDATAKANVANPCVIWDELDKAGTSDWNGNFHTALLTRLEPETSSAAHDDFLMTSVDQSCVTHIATAMLQRYLLSRFEVIAVPTPLDDEIDAILANFRQGLARDYGIEAGMVPHLPAIARERLRRRLREAGDLCKMRRMFEDEIARSSPLVPENPCLSDRCRPRYDHDGPA